MAHIDISIVDGDFSFSDNLTTQQLTNEQVIAQDVKHRILESGLLTKLVGLRNTNGIADVLTEIELEVEKDERLVPGSIYIDFGTEFNIRIKAMTRDYGQKSA